MSLTTESRKRFRTIGHNLKPIVTIAGNGLSEGVMAELERALEDHELIKVKLAVEDREDRRAIIDQMCSDTGAALIQTIGKVALIFRTAQKPDPVKSNAR